MNTLAVVVHTSGPEALAEERQRRFDADKKVAELEALIVELRKRTAADAKQIETLQAEMDEAEGLPHNPRLPDPSLP